MNLTAVAFERPLQVVRYGIYASTCALYVALFLKDRIDPLDTGV
jgi:hypothetical protein